MQRFVADFLAQPLVNQTDNETSIDCEVDPGNQPRQIQSHQSLSHSHTRCTTLGSTLCESVSPLAVSENANNT